MKCDTFLCEFNTKKQQIGREERTEGERKLKGEGVRKGEGDRKPKSDGVANEKACQQTKRKGNDPWVTRNKKKFKKKDERYSEILTAKVKRKQTSE